MGFNLGKALHALVGFTPLAHQAARVAAPQQKPHPNSPSREQISKFNQNMVDSAQRSGSPFPVQPGSISPANPDGTWLRQNLGLQVAPLGHPGLGASDEQVQYNGGATPIQAPYARPLSRDIQGGTVNPGFTPLQGSNIRYRQGPQPTQSWYDF